MELPTKLLEQYNDNVKTKLSNSVNDIDSKADYIVSKLNNPTSRPYYCKVAMKLSEAQINQNLELAMGGRDPRRYFTWLCNRQFS